MSNVNKLTYYQICLFAFQNRFNEIPAEYNIVWTGHQPCKVFEIELNSNCLKFTQNEIPIPTKINIKGEYIVHVDSSYHEMFNNIMEFGDIFINTDFSLTELKFIYESKENIEKMKPYLEIWANGYTGREPIKKQNITFSVDLTIPDYKLEIINLLPQNCIIENNLIVYFGYDYFTCTFTA